VSQRWRCSAHCGARLLEEVGHSPRTLPESMSTSRHSLRHRGGSPLSRLLLSRPESPRLCAVRPHPLFGLPRAAQPLQLVDVRIRADPRYFPRTRRTRGEAGRLSGVFRFCDAVNQKQTVGSSSARQIIGGKYPSDMAIRALSCRRSSVVL